MIDEWPRQSRQRFLFFFAKIEPLFLWPPSCLMAHGDKLITPLGDSDWSFLVSGCTCWKIEHLGINLLVKRIECRLEATTLAWWSKPLRLAVNSFGLCSNGLGLCAWNNKNYDDKKVVISLWDQLQRYRELIWKVVGLVKSV